MNLFLWKEELVPDRESAMAKARAGIAYLDKKYGRGWQRDIDVEQLDIKSPVHCVLGQLTRKGYFLLPTPRRAVECGFSCGIFLDLISLFYRRGQLLRSFALLTEAWQSLLRERDRRSAWHQAIQRLETLLPEPMSSPTRATGKAGSRRRTALPRSVRPVRPASNFVRTVPAHRWRRACSLRRCTAALAARAEH